MPGLRRLHPARERIPDAGEQQNIAARSRVIFAMEMTVMTQPADKPKRGLGRGLDALFADAEERLEVGSSKLESEITQTFPTSNIQHPISGETSGVTPSINSGARQLPIAILIPGPFQPRKTFDEAELKALAESIRVHGVLQPLLVRASETQMGKFEIIAGERRWRASQLAQLHEVPVMIRRLDNRAALEIGLIENIQRADLTPIEEAEGYQRLIKEFGHTQEALAEVIGKSRSYITNSLRLLGLPDEVRKWVSAGALTAGHARALVGLNSAFMMAEKAIDKEWSVRELERRVAVLKEGKDPVTLRQMEIWEMRDWGIDPATIKEALDNVRAARPRRPPAGGEIFSFGGSSAPKDDDVMALEREMANLLGLQVEIAPLPGEHSGMMIMHYSSLDQLDDLLQKLTRAAKH